MESNTQLSKWGHSLAVRIPRSMLDRVRWLEGEQLSVTVAEDGALVLRSSRRKYNLSRLVAEISPENRHSETDWGRPEGQEKW